MNLSNVIGLSLALAVFIGALFATTSNLMLFLDFHAILIVIGGTMSTAFICFSMSRVFGLVKVFVRRMLGKTKRDYLGLIAEVVSLSQAYAQGRTSFDVAVKKVTDPFLRDGAEILFWLESEVPADRLRDLLETRAATHFERYMDEASIFVTMAKFPPAFGLMGTTLGMIALLQSLGNEDAKNMIGPSMAVALVATLYGIVLANFVFMPIGENLKKQSKEDLVARRMVVEGVMLIASDLPSRFVEEQLKSFLLPSERGTAKGGKGASAKGPA